MINRVFTRENMLNQNMCSYIQIYETIIKLKSSNPIVYTSFHRNLNPQPISQTNSLLLFIENMKLSPSISIYIYFFCST